jgi:hypothetical protein
VAASQEQKLDYLLKKIGYVSSKTGIAEDENTLSGTKKAPFAEPIPSPLVVPATNIWADSSSIPSTPPGANTSYVQVYLAGSSGHRMTVDSTVSGNRTFIAYSTYNNTSTDILGDWIDPSFGSDYIIKVYKGDPNSGGVLLSAAGTASNDTWFFDYSSGVLNFNGSQVPSGVTSSNIYIVGYRYIGNKGAASPVDVKWFDTAVGIWTSSSVGIGTTNATSTLTVDGTVNVSGISTLGTVKISSGIVTATSGVVTYYGDGTNLTLTDSVALGGDTTGDYVASISGTANQIAVDVTSGEGTTPVISIPTNPTLPGTTVTIENDLQVNRDLNVNGNITIGGTSATLFTQTLSVADADLILGVRTDANGNDVSTDTIASHGGIAIASTEGTPLVTLVNPGAGETLPATYKKIMWFEQGAFAGLGTDAWLINYGVGIGSTQVPNNVVLAAGDVHITNNDIKKVRDINASGIITASTFVSNVSDGTSPLTVTSTTLVSNLNADKLDGQEGTYYLDYNNFVGVATDADKLDGQQGTYYLDYTNFTNTPTIPTVNDATLTLTTSGDGISGSDTFTANQSTNTTFTVTVSSASTNQASTLVYRDASGGFSAGIVTATSFVKASNSSGFLKADGTEDTSTYLTSYTETNDLSSAVTWANVPDANITESSVTQHQAALSITESQISDLQSYLTSYTETQTLNDVLGLGNTSSTGLSVGVVTATSFVKSSNSGGFLKADGTEDTSTYLTSFTETNDLSSAVTWANVPDTNITESSVTQHQAALSITESQISDLQSYLTSYTETQTLNDVVGLGSATTQTITVGTATTGVVIRPDGTLNVSGIATAQDFNSASDENLKTNIRTIEDPLAKVVQIRGVNFDWKETQRPSLGVIAQEVEKVLPELVTDNGTKTVNYNGLIGLLIETVKEQQKQIDTLSERLSKLE